MRFDIWNGKTLNRDKAGELVKRTKNTENPINPLVAALLVSRGITEPEKAVEYLDVEKIPFYDPFTLADMDKAVDRINKALKNNENIAIYGDYDVDGMTSAAMLALWLETKNAGYEIYIPGRLDEGYGLHSSALDTLKAGGTDLVITVDCGITAVEETEYAKNIGLDIVITDHHECKNKSTDRLPDATAVIDPKRPDCNYPFKDLAGAGVVYKLICALEGGTIPDSDISRYGQLAALGTIADVMPVTGENRKLIIEGLKHLNTDPIPGLKELMDSACPDTETVNTQNISFAIAPRLNAAGRMGDPMLSVHLLLSKNAQQANEYVAQLNNLNEERKILEQDILTEAVNMLEDELDAQGKTEPEDPIILTGENWNQGVSGIVAAKLADRYRLPVIIICIDSNGLGKGSARSYGSFGIYDALRRCADVLETFGGHDMAAGITIKPGNTDKLKDSLAQSYRTHTAATPPQGLDLDFEVTRPCRLLTVENIEALKTLEPFGRENPSPRLYITNAILSAVSSVGSGKHTKVRIETTDTKRPQNPSYPLEGIMFSATPSDLGVIVGNRVDIAFEPQINDYRDRKTVRLQILDIRKAQ